MQLLVNFRLLLLWMVLSVILINSVEHKLTSTLDRNVHNNKLLIGIRLFRLHLISPSEVHLRFFVSPSEIHPSMIRFLFIENTNILSSELEDRLDRWWEGGNVVTY